ncbi:hypothetical protein ACFQUU_26010 [Herbaspirillum sp. GCM10030257]|uniref:hypothetical protein n=1 Tax=Herbaspirillum sp. GCM10030257 TaxID=3273393 RepID=UPI0036120035
MSDLKLSAARLENCGKEAEKRILDAITSSELGAVCYAIRTRVKKESKLVEKVQIKASKKPTYSIKSITDVVGLRLITLFRSEMIDCVERVLDLIAHNAKISPNPFIKQSVEEIIIYSDAPAHDPFLVKLQELLNKRGVDFQIAESNNRYSSVHLVCRVSQPVNIVIDGQDCEHNVPLEIQVRTVFEDAWGEIDHRFGYVFRQGKNPTIPSANHAQIGPHLKVLKQFADACSQYADTIFGMATTPALQNDTSGKILSVGSDDDVLARFAALRIPRNLVDAYVEGRAMRDRAAEVLKDQPDEAPKLYLSAAKHFGTTCQSLIEEKVPADAHRLFHYYLAMNEALCLLSTDNEIYVQKAIELYDALLHEYSQYPLVKFRMAQAYGKLGQPESAIHLYQEVRALITALRQNLKQGVWTDQLPKSDFEHMSGLLPKLLGYQYWRRGELLPINSDDPSAAIEEKALCFQRAYEETVSGKALRPDDIYISNNMAYYACAYISLANGQENALVGDMLKTIEATAVELEKSNEVIRENPDLFLLDTLLRCYEALGHDSNAKRVAKKIASQRTRLAELDPKVAVTIQNRALDAMSK